MSSRSQWRDFRQSKPVRTALFVIGLLLIALSPVAGAIPGPGGIFVLAAGLALTLQNSDWAKRQYVRFKRWQPKAGNLTDRGLRRRSAQRREALRKLREKSREARKQRRRARPRRSIVRSYWLRQNLRPLYRLLQRARVRRRKSQQRLLSRLASRPGGESAPN